MSDMVTQRSEATQKEYEERARRFIAMVARDLGLTAPNALAVVTYFLTTHGRWSESSIRQIRAYLLHVFAIFSRQYPDNRGLREALRLLGALDPATGRLASPTPCARVDRGTSANKRKSLTPTEAAAFYDALRMVEHRHAEIAQIQTWFGISLGLRPVEWETATIIDGHLVVQNAKATNGRANGPTRSLPLEEFGAEFVASLAAGLEVIAEARKTETWAAIHRNVARAMTAASIKAGETCPSLRDRPVCPYTLRHVATARMKGHLPPEVIAAVLGHRSISTASRHYAPARSAKGFHPIAATASPADVARIVARNRAATHDPAPIAPGTACGHSPAA